MSAPSTLPVRQEQRVATPTSGGNIENTSEIEKIGSSFRDEIRETETGISSSRERDSHIELAEDSVSSTCDESTAGVPLPRLPTASASSLRPRRAVTSTEPPTSVSTSVKRSGRRLSVLSSLRMLILGSYINVFLVFIPIMFVARFALGNTGSEVFVFAFLALLPAAKIFGLVMENLTMRMNPHIGRFIRVLAGNIIELISGVIAIIQCQFRVLQASLIGSILINILLVQGCAFFSGGATFYEFEFSTIRARTTIQLLTIGAVATLIPNVFMLSTTVQSLPGTSVVILLDHIISLILCFCYSAFLAFQFFSHATLFADDQLKSTRYPIRGQDPEVGKRSDNPTVEASSRDYRGEEHNFPLMDLFFLFSMAVVEFALITALSEFLVSSLSNLASGSMVSKEWLGMILIPLAGTFARHDLLEAIHYGQKDALSDSLALSMGSSVNLVLFIQPTLVLVAWIIWGNVPLLYDSFESLTLFLSVLVVNLCLASGKNVWLSGVGLISLYVLIGTTFWFYTGGTFEETVESRFPGQDVCNR